MGFLKQKPRGWLETNAWARQYLNSLQYNVAQAGSVVPLIFGTTRQNINLIGFGNYQGPQGKKGKGVGPLPIGGTSNTGKGGGGKSKKAPPDYTIDVAFGICEGAWDGPNEVSFLQNTPVWASAGRAGFAHGLNLNGYNGALGQAADPTMAGLGQVVGYSGTAYVTGTPLDLGSSPVLPNASIALAGIAASIDAVNQVSSDANPGDVVRIFLTDSQVGAEFPTANVDSASLSDYFDYCAGQFLPMSPALTTQNEAIEWLSGIMKLTNSTLVWTGSVLKFIPWTDLPVAGWNPNVQPIYTLFDNDFLLLNNPSGDGSVTTNEDDPIVVTRSNPADAANWLTIEYLDVTNNFVPTVVPVFDQQAVDTYGRRSGDNIPGHAFTNPTAAQISAQAILQRLLYVRNTYKFRLGWNYSLLEPMDVVCITDARIGLNQQPVRIVVIEENENGDLSIEAEDLSAVIFTGAYVCLNEVQCTYNDSSIGSDTSRSIYAGVDSRGSWYGGPVINACTLVYDLTCTNLADSIDAWFGSTIVNRGSGFSGSTRPQASVLIYDYILWHMQAGPSPTGDTLTHWWVISTPIVGTGMVPILGAVYYGAGATDIPYNDLRMVGIAESGGLDDAIIFLGNVGTPSVQTTVGVLPTINLIAGGAYTLYGFGGILHGLGPCRVPQVRFTYFGKPSDADLGTNFFPPGLIYGSKDSSCGIVTPSPVGGTRIAFYLNKTYTQFNLGFFGASGLQNTEIENVIGPTYPNGSALVIDLGEIFWQAVATACVGGGNLGPTPTYQIINAIFQDSGGVICPFDDEWSSISGNATPPTYDYYTPRTVQLLPQVSRGRGMQLFQIMSGDGDASGSANHFKYYRIRLFQYIYATGVWNQQILLTCLAYTPAQVPTAWTGRDLDIMVWYVGQTLYTISFTSAINDLVEIAFATLT